MTISATSSRWRLESVTVRSFRGVAGEQVYKFGGKPGMLRGNNGVGKSTVAQTIQWTLYGEFPPGVLENKSPDSFLGTVTGKKKSYSGELVFVREGERLVLGRHAGGDLSLKLGSESWEGEEAEAKRDALLGLDGETFVRAVVLHQSRIRGLLLDAPKERNRAMDRLLGMDMAEGLMEVLRPKDFSAAAEEVQEEILLARTQHETEEEMLRRQREEAESRARELKFGNKDFNPAGLAAAYANLGAGLQSLARKHEVSIPELPSCPSVEGAKKVSAAFAQGLKTIRSSSKATEGLSRVLSLRAKLNTLKEQWQSNLAGRDGAHDALEKHVAANGDAETLAKTRSDLSISLRELREDLKAAGALRQLLADALSLMQAQKTEACPVCLQTFPSSRRLTQEIQQRMESLATEAITQKQSEVSGVEERLGAVSAAQEELELRTKNLGKAQQTLDASREQIAKELGSGGLAEIKVAQRLEEALSGAEKQWGEAAAGAQTLEQELEALDNQERMIREGIIPVLRKREEQAQHERAWKETETSHAEQKLRAERLEQLGAELASIRTALLAAKDELATKYLDGARPRALELYRALIRHRLFDTLQIETKPSKAKVDYTFQVSAKGNEKTAREARLVLSDGQLTAAAVGLFFALAESASHGLDLLYLDDPTQNLDLPCKEAMAKVIADLARRKQVIVSSQDEDFINNLLSEGFGKSAVIHHLEKWDGNPTVKSTFP